MIRASTPSPESESEVTKLSAWNRYSWASTPGPVASIWYSAAAATVKGTVAIAGMSADTSGPSTVTAGSGAPGAVGGVTGNAAGAATAPGEVSTVPPVQQPVS